MDEEEEVKKFEMEENEEKGKKNTLDKEALCERLKTYVLEWLQIRNLESFLP